MGREAHVTTSKSADTPPVGESLGRAFELVCPSCHGPLGSGPLRCEACGRAFPVHEGVPVFLDPDGWEAARSARAVPSRARDDYSRVRRACILTQMYYDAWVDRLLAEVPRDGGALVELMCGEGELSRRLPPWVRAALAVDRDPEAAQVAARDLAHDRRVTVAVGDATALPVATGGASAVVIIGGLHHARPELARILREVARVLRPRGVLVASEPANDHPLVRRVRRWQYSRSTSQGHDPDEDGFTRGELELAMAPHGLRLATYGVFGFVAYPLMGNTDLLPLLEGARSRLLGRALLGLDAALERVPVIRRLGWASRFVARREATV